MSRIQERRAGRTDFCPRLELAWRRWWRRSASAPSSRPQAGRRHGHRFRWRRARSPSRRTRHYGAYVAMTATVEQAISKTAFSVDQDKTKATGKEVLGPSRRT